jgi:phosphoribosylformylglycinamidine cyclo-ligase
MNVNDLLTFGAEPLFLLDYLAMGRLNRRVMGALVRGIARGCRESGAALLGGETAEMPGCYGPGEYDIAGFAVGMVERRRLVDGTAVRQGDVIVFRIEVEGLRGDDLNLFAFDASPAVR